MFGQQKNNILIENVSFKKDKNGWGLGLAKKKKKKKKRTVEALGEITKEIEKE